MNFTRLAVIAGTVATAAVVIFGGMYQAASASTAPVRGIDVSSYQHPGGQAINWREVVHYGYKFVFIKDTEGTYYVNPWYKTDLAGAEAHGMKAGSYAFAIPNKGTGASQAAYLLSHGGYQKSELAPTLDIEWNPYGSNECYGVSTTAMRAWINSFESYIHSHTGVWAIINTPRSWWDACTGDYHDGSMPLWDENNHGAYPSSPVLPVGWSTWSYWQNTNEGHVGGVPGTVDLDVRN